MVGMVAGGGDGGRLADDGRWWGWWPVVGMMAGWRMMADGGE